MTRTCTVSFPVSSPNQFEPRIVATLEKGRRCQPAKESHCISRVVKLKSRIECRLQQLQDLPLEMLPDARAVKVNQILQFGLELVAGNEVQ